MRTKRITLAEAQGMTAAQVDQWRRNTTRWLTTRAEGYRQDAHHMEYAKPGETTKLRSDSISPRLRRAIADELDQLAEEIARLG
jgi:hypothetical protein